MSALRVYLQLGRVSNLPTVWTNVLAGGVLSGAALGGPALPLLLVGLTLFYTGGMFLNDAFDSEHDAREQPFRPIPSGRISLRHVRFSGFALLLGGVSLVAAAGQHRATLVPALAGAVALAAAIVLYDLWHKQNPLSPVLMGLCRALVYVVAGVTLQGALPTAVMAGAVALFVYLNLLTAVAKRRGVPGKVVARFIAGICVVDALAILVAGKPALALLALLGFPLTLVGQRYVRGT